MAAGRNTRITKFNALVNPLAPCSRRRSPLLFRLARLAPTVKLVIFTLVLGGLAAGCSGQVPNSPVPAPAPSSVPTLRAVACQAPEAARQTVQQFIDRYNAKDIAGTLSLIGTPLKQYIDPTFNVALANPSRVDMEAMLGKRFAQADMLIINGPILSVVDPVAAANQYNVTAKITRTNSANSKWAGDLTVAVDCPSAKMTLIAIIGAVAK